MATSKEYWKKRSLERLTSSEKTAMGYLRNIYDVYEKAQKQAVEDVKRMYLTYFRLNTWDSTELNKIVPNGDFNKFYADLEKAGIARYLPDRFNGRLTRAEMMNAEMWKQVKQVALAQGDLETRAHAQAVVDGYYRTIFDYSKKLGETPSFNKMDVETVEKVLGTRFKGANYSERIWKNTDKLADSLAGVLGKAIANGQGVEKTTNEIRERFEVGKFEAMRLAQTETCYFENMAEIQAYKEMGIDRFEYVATLDSRTSDICRSMDGRIFKMREAEIGENVPPLHPFCRSTIVAYLGSEYETKERIARNPETNQNYFVNGSTTYFQWQKRIGADILKQRLEAQANQLLLNAINPKPTRIADADVARAIGVSRDYFKDNMVPSERAFARQYTLSGHNIRWINQRKKDASGKIPPMNDYSENNILWELKTPKRIRYSSISKAITDAAKKGKKNFMINFGERKLSEKMKVELSKYNIRHAVAEPKVQIKRLHVFTRGEVVEIELQ